MNINFNEITLLKSDTVINCSDPINGSDVTWGELYDAAKVSVPYFLLGITILDNGHQFYDGIDLAHTYSANREEFKDPATQQTVKKVIFVVKSCLEDVTGSSLISGFKPLPEEFYVSPYAYDGVNYHAAANPHQQGEVGKSQYLVAHHEVLSPSASKEWIRCAVKNGVGNYIPPLNT